jgi:2-iminoacetate synthase
MRATESFLQWLDFDIDGALASVDETAVKKALSKDVLSPFDFLALVSEAAEPFLEVMARKAMELTAQHFGRAVLLFAPLYLADYCQNQCLYCGFSARNRFPRHKLSRDEIEANGEALYQQGFRHILLLTGDSPVQTPVDYLEEAIEILSRRFESIAVEVYPLEQHDYQRLRLKGLDGLTIYQETYDRAVYDEVHPSGPKKDYLYRLQTPERGALAGLRWITLGALYGLANPIHDAFWTAMHLVSLKKFYPFVEWGVSLPRMNPAEGIFSPRYQLSDKRFVQFLLAFRIFFPTVGITLSTRERPEMRDILIPLGITKMSAGSHTEVGGYASEEKTVPQFEIADNRSVEEVVAVIRSKGFDPVFKDWVGVV